MRKRKTAVSPASGRWRVLRAIITIVAALCLPLASCVNAQATTGQVYTSEGRVNESQGRTLRRLLIGNPSGSYTLGVALTDSPPRTEIGLPQEPHHHNFPPWNFCAVSINGIDLRDLEPKSIQAYAEVDEAGWEMRFNFNGVLLVLRFFLRPDSPVLWCRGQTETLPGVTSGECTVSISCYPGIMIARHFLSDVYERTVYTPERTLDLPVKPGSVQLSPDDRLLFFDDRKHPSPEGAGPCLVILDWTCLKSAEVRAGTQSHQATTKLVCDPARAAFQFGVFSSGKSYTRDELRVFVEERAPGFVPR